MAAVIFNGAAVKALKDIIRLKAGIEIITNDSDDPTLVAKNAPASSLYLRQGTGEVYVKTDAGSSTNWNLFTTSTAPPIFDVSSISTNTNAVSGATYLVDVSGGAVTVTLPAPAVDAFVRVKDSSGSANTNNITVARNGSESIDGVAGNFTLDSNYESAVFVSDGTDWWRL
jgi:hypothetical protein